MNPQEVFVNLLQELRTKLHRESKSVIRTVEGLTGLDIDTSSDQEVFDYLISERRNMDTFLRNAGHNIFLNVILQHYVELIQDLTEAFDICTNDQYR